MVDDKINKLIEKFIDVKESKGLTEEQVAKLSGLTPLRIHNLFNGKVVHPSFDLTTKVAEALEIPFDEVCEILEYIADNNTVPRNIREAASDSSALLKDEDQDQSVRISTVLGKLDEISNDPNIPVHARTLIWEVLSKLESI